MRAVAVFALVAAACGLSVTGTDPAVVTGSDAGASSSSSTSSSSSSGNADSGIDAGPPISCADVANDPDLRHCLDFDEGMKDKFGFDDLDFDGPLKPSLSLEPSPLGTRANSSFAVNFFGDMSSTGKRALAARLTWPDFGGGKYTHVTFDVDVSVDQLDDYAVVAGMAFAGESCSEFAGLAVNKNRELIHWEYPGTSSKVLGKYELKKTFHVHMEASPGGPAEKPLTIAIDGGTADAFQTALPFPACNYGAAFVGNYFASQGANDSMHARFDQFVMRGTQ